MKTFYVGVKGLIVKEKSVLILKRERENNSYAWDIPGGRIDGEESVEQALQRELREELGDIKKITSEKLLHVFRMPFCFPDGHGLFLVYFKVSADIAEITLSEEHIGYLWLEKEIVDEFFQHEERHLSEQTKIAIHLAFGKN